jgi:hypothetical protein
MKIAVIPKRQPALKSIVLFFAMLLAAGVSAESLQSFEASSGLYGYKNSKGQIKIPPRFVYAEEFNRYGFASVIESGKPYFIDQQGRHVVQMFFFDNGPDPFEEGLARFVEKGKMGFFDERGRKVIPASFDFVSPFSNGMAEACNGCKPRAMGEHFMMEGGVWMMVDKRGRTSAHPTKGPKKDNPPKK